MQSELRTRRNRATPPANPAAQFEYRRMRAAELPQLNDLYNAYYPETRPLEHAAWLYAGNPNGAAVIYAAYDEHGALAGMRPSIPYRVWWQGEERTAYEFSDALVDPRYQRRGIFSRLLVAFCEWADAEGHLLYTLPNDNSLAVYRRMPHRLQAVGESCTLARPLAWVRYAAQQLKRGLERAAAPEADGLVLLSQGATALRAVDRFDAGFAGVECALKERGLSFVLRTPAYLQWRYLEAPTRKYHVALVEQDGAVRGYLVLRLVCGVAQVVDLFVDPAPELVRHALALAARWAQTLGASGIHFVCVGNALYQDAAWKSGYWLKRRSRPFVMNSMFARTCSGEDLYFAMGDFDFF